MKALAVIPARYASTRFPVKALASLAGIPIIQHVYQRVVASGLFSEVIVATDHPAIMDAVKAFHGKAMMTSDQHPSGSDRIAEVLKHYPGIDVIVNVQGDEPLIERQPLADLLQAFSDPSVNMASLMTPITDPEMLSDPNIVKVVTDSQGDAIYFSRSCVPYNRDHREHTYYRHIGVYAYRPDVLEEFVSLPQGILEQTEKLEQLRALEHGIPIRMVLTDYQGVGIDTPADLDRVEKLLETQQKRSKA